MNFFEAKQEFETRYYLWAISESKKEINENFPNLRLFKNGACWQLHQFMQQLNKDEQLILSHGLLKSFHPNILPLLGQRISTDENILLDKFVGFRRQFSGVKGPKFAPSGEKIKFASKKSVKKLIAARFQFVYERRCMQITSCEDQDLQYEMKIAGWKVSTRFIFSGRFSFLDYDHAIESEETIPNPPFPPELWMPAMRLGYPISFGRWLGLGGTSWERLLPEEVEQVCDMVVKFCGQFFEAVPGLLKGLEFEKINEGGLVRAQP